MCHIDVYPDFDALPRSCEALFANVSRRQGIFVSLPWFRNLASSVFAQDELRIYVLHASASGNGEDVSALISMCNKRQRGWHFPIRHLVATSNFYTPLFAPLVAERANAAKSVELLVQAIAAESPKWDTVTLYPMDYQDSLFMATLAACRSAGMAAVPYRCFGNWYLRVGARTYSEYLASLPPRLQNTIRRQGRKLAAAGRLRMAILSREEDVQSGIDAYLMVYQASWKSPELHPDFMPGWIRTCAKEGWLRLGIAYVDDRPAAAQVWTVAGDIASIYKLAYDEQFKKYSVGSLLTAHLMHHVIEIDRVVEVDFLSGDDMYKQDWMSDRRERWGVVAFNLKTPKGLLLATLDRGRKIVKNLCRPFRQRR